MASSLSGLIPAHTIYESAATKEGAPFTRTPRRVRPEAKENANNGLHGTIGKLFEEGFVLSGVSCGAASARRPGKQPKNHIEENVRRMRRIQREYKAARTAVCEDDIPTSARSAAPMKALWKSDKYSAIPSKVAAELQKPELAPEKTYSSMTLHHGSDETAHRPRSAGSYLRAHSRTGIPSTQGDVCIVDGAGGALEVEKLNLSRAGSCDNLTRLRHSSDFVRINGIAASRVALRQSPRSAALQYRQREKEAAYENWKKTTQGNVPAYLQKRRELWEREEEERVLNAPDPDMPPGHRPMPSEEQQQTLELLHKTHRELQARLTALPIRSDTLRLQKAKEELETKMTEVEEAVKVFSRPKVFVKMA